MAHFAGRHDTMRVRTIRTTNFKSLVDFTLDLAKFTCLIGLNSAGKSTVLQLVDFLGQQVRGDIRGWLRERNWSSKDLKSQFSKKTNIDFSVRLADGPDETCSWEGSFNTRLLRCTTEHIRISGAEIRVHEGSLNVIQPDEAAEEVATGAGTAPAGAITFDYEGSLLSQLKESALPAPLLRFKRHIERIHSLDLLSPEHLRQRTRESEGSLGLGGQRLSAFLHELGAQKRHELVQRLTTAYPQLEDLDTRSLRSGWKQLEITEAYQGEQSGLFPRMTTEARHVADGMLRLIAILAEIQTEHRLLLFDEIENGINPELVEFVLDALVSARQQVLVTTHSPMILNYLQDDVAKEGVIYLYKTRKGHTQSIPFFSIPSVAEKLTVMGPGEAFADTNLTALQDEIEAVAEGR
jgi:predicted ATPase